MPPVKWLALVLAAVAGLLSTAFFAVPELATLRGAKAHDATALLTTQLGQPQADAVVVGAPTRTWPALGGKLQITAGGLRASAGRSSVSLRLAGDVGRGWRTYERGVARDTAFGREAISFGADRVEESLLVEHGQGKRVWRWQLGAANLDPRLRLDGTVELSRDGRDTGLSILPVAVLDADGKDVTPAGARWSLARAHGKRWLELRLDDAELRTPYVIDPIVAVGTCGAVTTGDFNGCSVHAVSNRSSFASSPLVRPGSVATGDLMLAQITIRNSDAITAPAGWTLIGNKRTSGTGLEQALYYKFATAGDTAGTTYSWSWTNNADAAGAILAYSGVDSAAPFNVTPTDNSATSAAVSATGLTTTQNGAMLVALYGAQGNVVATQDAGLGLTQEYTDLSGSGPASRARITGSDGTQATAGATGNKTASLDASSQWVAHLAALTPVLAADGSGTLTTGTSAVSASQTGNTVTFTYTAATNGMQNGTVTIAVPTGWSAPSITATAAGYTTASTGTVSVAGQTITVSGVTLAGGATMTITYGSKAGGGAGATATSTTGAQTWQAQQRSKSTGTLTNLASSPSITVYAADGSGTLTSGTSAVSAGQTGRTITFTYTAAAGGMSSGSVTLAVPSGWSAPSTTGTAAGYTTSSAGSVSVSGQTITVSGLTLAAGNTFTITYGSTAGGGTGATATSTTGAQTWQAQEKSTSGGALANLASSPGITVYAADGGGTLTAGTSVVSAGQTGRTITFTYTAPTGGISGGSVTFDVPSGWSAPSTTGSAAGYTTASAGSVSVSGQTITVSGLTVAAGSTFTITYGSTASGGPAATASSTTGAQTWQAQETSTSGGTLTNLGSSPSITVYAADGSGTLTTPTTTVIPSSTGNTITFTYTAATGGLSNGSVTVAVPAGWSAPSTTGSAAGYTTASTGTVSVSGQTITVSSITIAAGNTFTITYGSKASGGPGATAPSSTGSQTWQAQEKSTSAGTLTNLASSPSIGLTAADGSGTLTTPTSSVNSGATGRTITFTYTAAAGGLSSGAVTVAVPTGWSAPSTTGTAAGYTTASTGTLSVSGQTITVSSVTISGGSTFTITYGSTAGGGPGATAPTPAGAQTWQAQEKSTAAGTLTDLASSPSITVNDPTGPSAPSLSFASFTNASATGNTVYVRQGTAGGFTVAGTSSDAESGIDHLTFPSALGTGWTGGGADTTSPYQGVYTFTAASTAPAGNQDVTATNGWSLTSSATSFTIVADTTAPSVTAPSVTAGYYTSLSVPVTKNGGTDGGSGVDATTSVLQRDDATLTNGSCGAFSGTWTNVTLVGGNDTSVVTGKCYEYRERLSDNVGNQGTSPTSNIAKIDTTAPSAPTLAFSNLSASAYWDGSGTLYFRPAAGGTFTVTGAATDTQSGIASYTFGSLNSNGGSNWSGTQTGDHVDYTFDATTTAPTTARTVSATNGAGTASSNATYNITADTTAPSVTAPSVTAGYYTSLSVPVTKNGGSDGGAGVDATTSVLQRDDAPLTNGSCGSFSGSWTTVTLVGGNDTGVSSGRCYEYRERLSDRVGNQGTSGVGNVAKVDNQTPGNSLSLSSVSPAGAAYKSGTTVFYRGSATGGGSFKLTNAVTDSESGPASSATAALGGTTTGWTHTGSTVSTPAGGPYDSSTFTWAQGTTSSPTEVVTGADAAGNTNAAATLTFADDSTAPAGGALTVNGVTASGGGSQSYDADGSFPIDVRTDYTEAASGSASGLASSTLVRTTASFTTGDTCGAFGSPATISGNPSESGLATGCYRYILTGTDNVGNAVSISTTVKVDTSAPSAPSLSFGSLGGGAYYPGSGVRVYFKPDAATGTFDLTASSTDNDSGVASYSFPTGAAVGTSWSRSGSGATRTYSYTATATTNGSQTVTATNNAGLTSGTTSFDVTADSTAPTGGALTVNGVAASGGGTSSYDADGSFPIDLRTDYAETQTASASGLASSTLVRTSASYTSPDVCGSFGSPVTISGNASQSGLATACYRYTLTGTDNVGNAVAVSTIVKVDNSAPTQPTLSFSGVTGGAYYSGSGTRVFFKPDATGGGSFDVSASSTDGDTGVASYQFPSGATVGTSWSFSGSGAMRTYTFTPTATTNGTQSVTATNNAGGISTGAGFDVTADAAAPTGGALTVNGTAATGGGSTSYNGSGSFTIGTRTDYGESASSTESGLAGSTLTRTSATLSGDSCGAFGSPTTLVGAPAQNGLATGCYRYTLTGADNVGNTVSISATVKVDTSAPGAPSLTLSNATGGAYYPGSGTRLFFRPGAAAGSFDLAASSTDADTGVASYAFPTAAAVGSSWSVAGSGSSRTYSYTATASTNGTQNVTATNLSGLVSSASTFDVTADSTAPSGGAVTVNGTAATGAGSASYDDDGSFAIGSRTDYTEPASATASGLASSTLTRESATLSGDSCGSFGSATTLVGTPAQSGLATGCYRYRLTGTDNVGNAVSVTTIVKVDTSAPSAPSLSFSNVTGGAFYPGSGTTVYFLPGAASGSFDVTAAATENDTAVAGYQLPAGSALGTNWSGSGSGASRTYSYTSGATSNGAQNVTATNTAGGVSANGTFTVATDTSAPTTSVQCNGAACIAGYYTSSPVSVTLSGNDGAGSGVQKIRYTTDGSDPTLANGSDYSGAISVNTTSTVKFRAYDNLGNVEAVGSETILLDGTAPSGPALTLAENPASASQHVSGTTVFYKPGSSGTFRVTAVTDDPETGVTQVVFPAVANVTGGSTQTTAPYREDYSWGASTSDNGSHNVVATNGAGATSTAGFSLAPDSTAPTGQSITLTGASAPYFGSGSVTFSLGDGTDGTGAGVDASTRTVTRETGNLVGDSCSGFTADPGTFSSPDTSVSSGHCYRYTFTVKDNVGNVSAAVTATAKVDTASPAVAVTAPTELTGGGDQHYDGATKTQFFRPAGSGSFALNATASDVDTGVTGVAFPDVSATSGWSGSTGGTDATSPYSSPATYSWSSGASQPGAQNLVATDKAGNTASDAITLKADGSAPTGQTVTLTGANAPYFTSASVTFTTGDGSDNAGGAGLDTSTRSVTRETGDLAGDSCSNWSADGGTFSSPDNAVASGHCYRYTFTIKDNVGNVSAPVTATAKVDTTAPAAPTLSFGSFTNASATGTTVFFRQGATGGFTVTATSTDAETGIASTSFPALGSGWSNTGGVYSFNASAVGPSGNQNVTSRNGAGVDSTASPFTVVADSAAPISSVKCNGVACSSGWYTSSPVSVTLTAIDGFGSGVDRIRYTTDGTDPTLVNGSDYLGAIAVASTTTIKFRAYDNVGNAEAVATQTVQVDTTPPSAPSLTLNEASPYEYVSGTTLFYNPSGSNSAAFTVSATANDGESAIQKTSFPSLTGMVGGGDDTSSPFQAGYGWDNSATTSPGSADVTAYNNANLTSQSAFTVTKDVSAPTGGSVDYPNGFQSSTSVTITTADGSDGTGAGVDAASGVLERQTATLTNGTCGSYGAWSPVTSPDTVASGTCAVYRYRVSDKVGNQATYTSPKVVRVDTTAPTAPTLTLSESSPFEYASGSTLYYNPSGSNAATFTVGAATSDGESGVAQVDFPTVFGGDSSTQASAPYSNAYSWTGGASASGARTVGATNGSGLGATADFTLAVDTTAPSGGTFDYPDGYSTSGSVTITTPSATDGGAGVDASSAVLERQTATLSSGSCGSFSGWSPVTSPDTVANGLCAVYRYRISDRVGNEATYASAHVVQVDAAGPTVSVVDPGTPVGGTVAVSANASDPLSGVQQVVFQRSPAGAGSWTQIGAADTTAPYSVNWDTTALTDGLYDLRAIGTDVAGNTTTSALVANRRVDNTAPSTTIDSAPPNPDNDATPTFVFSSSEAGSTFECRIDGGSWSSCSSPFTAPSLAEGSHTFDVRATDPAGNTDATPGSRTWTIDLTAPSVSWNSPSSGANVSGIVTLDASGEPGATIAYAYSPAGANSWTSTGASWNTVPLADGAYDLRAIATDAAGNPSAPDLRTNVGVDNHAPTLAITAPTNYLNAADPNPFTITASSADTDLANVKFYECSDASTACSSGTWNLIGTDVAAPYSTSWNAPVADGRKAIRAVATDNASNTGADVKTITVDRTAPTGVTVSYAGGYAAGAVTITTSNGPDPDVDASTAVLDRQTATLTNDTCGGFGGFSPVTSPDTVPSGQCAKYRYRVSDQAGNVATATSATVVKRDTAAPTSLQDDPGANLRGTVSLTASASDTGGSGLSSVAFQRRAAGGGAWTTIGTDTSSPYSVSFDTTSVSDGLYDFRTVATDAAGNAEGTPTVVANRRIDNTAPSATMLTPADGSRVKGTVALTSGTSDAGSGVASFSYELAPVPGAFAGVATPWDTTSVVDGAYRLRVVVTDNAGNTTTSAAVSTTVDNTPPSAIFSSPATGSVVSGTVVLDATASDASPATPAVGFEVKLHSDPPSAYTSTPASWNSAAAGDGLYDLRASATDAAGNTTRVENTSILADNFAPAVSITAPATSVNASVSSPTSFDATASDSGSGVQKVDFYECSNTSTDCSTGTWNLLTSDSTPPYSTAWPIPADGNHALRAVATDNASHTSSAIRNVTVDRTAPNTTITGKPANPSNAAATFTFGSSESGSSFECALDGGAWASCSSPKTYSGLADSTHTVDVRATDAAGNVDPTPDTWTWLRDTTAPTATIGDPGPNVRLTVNLTSTSTDPGGANASGVATTQFEYSGNGGASWAPTAAAWNTTSVSDGLYKVHVVVTDNAGNQTTVPVGHDVRVDNTAPSTTQDDPGAFLRTTKTLTGSAADAGSGVDHVDFQRSPAGAGTWTTIGTDTTSPYSAAFDTTTVTDGHYDFRTVAYDVAGNQTASAAVASRLVDNTAPDATMTDPGPYVRGTVNLGSTTSDPNGTDGSGVASVAYEYSTDGGTTWNPTAGAFNTTALADGNVRLHVVATDNAGNVTTSSSVSDLVDNTKPVTTDNAPSGYQSTPVTVTLSPSDSGSGINVTQYAVDGGSFQVGTSVNVPAPSDGSNDGAHAIAYFSVDNAGNIEQVKSTTVLIDATPPTCPSCSAADYLRGNVTLSASPSAGGSGIQSVTFEYSPAGAGTWTTIGTDTTAPAPYTAAWNTTVVADGHYDLRVVVVDNANNSSTTNLPDKVVDNTAPSAATVGAPTEGATVTGTVAITASAADATSPIASVEFFVRGASVTTDTTAPYSFNWNSAGGPDGAATIYVVVTDMAGNARTSPMRNVAVDNGAPAPALADPGQYLSGTVTFNATSDPDTTQLDFQRAAAGSGVWTTIAADNTAPYSASLDTTLLTDGLYDFRVVAVDGNSNSGTSAVRANVRVDNTAPAGTLTSPNAGAPVGGSSVNLAVSASDTGSGVASVRYECRATGGSSFAAIATSTTSPFGAAWDTTGLVSGSYDLRPVLTDRAGNVFTGAAVTVTVDATAPTVTLADPGGNLSGTVQLNATVTGSGATKVAFGYGAAGANSWSTIATDTTAPYSSSFDTTQLPDGLYDLRAVVSDSVGNSSQSVRTQIRIDNDAPRLVSSIPADGSRVDDASSIELVLSEEGTAANVTLDGTGTVAPVVNGTRVNYGTGALALGPHTLAGELKDTSGHSAQFRVHFTVWKASSAGVAPMIEKNTAASSATHLTSADGFATVTMPSGAWAPRGNDWLVLRVKPQSPPVGLATGFGPSGEVVDVTAYWALGGGSVHEFGAPIQILLPAQANGVVPATSEGSGFRVLRRVPSAPTLPASWNDGFYSDGAGFHILTRHLTQFTLLHDVEAPSPPTGVRGYRSADGVDLSWKPGADNSGTYDFVSVRVDGSVAGTYAAGTTSGAVDGDVSRAFALRETDLAGNESTETKVAPVPPLVGLSPEDAAAALEAAGFHTGTVTSGGSGVAGTVSGPAGLVLAEAGATIDLTVADGSGGSATKLVFGVVSTPKLKTTQRTLGARIKLTRAARVTAVLYSPRSFTRARNLKLYTWRFALHAGTSIVKLRLPTQIRRPGLYRLSWTARAGSDSVSRSRTLRVVGSTKPAPLASYRWLPRYGVVLAGSSLRPGTALGFGRRGPRVLVAGNADAVFELAGANANVGVVVVDVDQFGVGLVSDVRIVFPNVKIVAISSSPALRDAAKRAGASVTLARPTSKRKLTTVVTQLLKLGR